HAVLRLGNKKSCVTVLVHTLLDGTGCFERYLEITNNAGSPAAISRLAVMNGAVESFDIRAFCTDTDVGDIYELGYFDCEYHGSEGDFTWHKLSGDVTSFGGRYSRLRYRSPAFILKNTLTGNVMTAQLAYSGGYRFSFDRRAHYLDCYSTLCFSAEIDSVRPLCVLRPGETLRVPSVHVGMIHGDADDAINEMNAHVRKSVLCLPEASAESCTICSGIGPENDMSADTIKRAIDQMARAGAEAFIVDAGWYVSPSEGTAADLWWTKAGDWHFAADRFPGGISEISDYARSKGLKFGLWMEPERIGPASPTYESNKDMFTVNRFGERSNGFLDLTRDEVREWCENEIARVIEEYRLDLFRLDQNVEANEFFHVNGETGIDECMAMRHVEGFYKLYGNLKKRFPGVIFENCAGGGGRCDLGMMRFFDHTWVSDNQVPPRSLLVTNGMTMMLPPEKVDRLVAGMNCHTAGSLDFHIRNAMLSHMSLNCFGQKDCVMNDEIFDFVKHSTDLYKSFIRPILPECRIYHHNPDSREILKNGVCAIEEALPDGSRGVIGVFTLPGRRTDSIIIRPKGVLPGKKYAVTFDNTSETAIMSGTEMIGSGVAVVIKSQLSSELITYREADGL
ncbi:MAG: alpha-galactosidase, partial [Clostridia bacterium]|nr:alpha-galactosidase [Clostridia bacterium]